MAYSDNPIADFNAHDIDQAKRLVSLPICSDCGESIQDEQYYEFDGNHYCVFCVEAYHRKKV